MADVQWTGEALLQLSGIIEYIEQFDRTAAVRIDRQLRALSESLVDFPHRGRPASRGTRELPSVKPYVLRYKVIDDTVYILGIRHGRQRPPE